MAKGNWNPPSDTMRCDVSPIACQRVNVNVRDEASHRMSPPGGRGRGRGGLLRIPSEYIKSCIHMRSNKADSTGLCINCAYQT